MDKIFVKEDIIDWRSVSLTKDNHKYLSLKDDKLRTWIYKSYSRAMAWDYLTNFNQSPGPFAINQTPENDKHYFDTLL